MYKYSTEFHRGLFGNQGPIYSINGTQPVRGVSVSISAANLEVAAVVGLCVSLVVCFGHNTNQTNS